MGSILKSAMPPSQPRLKPMDVFRDNVGTSFKDSATFKLAIRNYYTAAYPTLSHESDLVARIESSDDSKTIITSLVCRNATYGCKLSFVLAHTPDTPPGHPVSRPILLSCHPTHSKRHCPLIKVVTPALLPSSPHRQIAKPAQNVFKSGVEKPAGKTSTAGKTLSQMKKELKMLRMKNSAPPEPRLDGDAIFATLRDSSPDLSAASTLIPAGQSDETKDGSSLDIDTDETMCDSAPVKKDEHEVGKDTAQSSFAAMKQAKTDRKLKRKTSALTTGDDKLAEDTAIPSDAKVKQENKDKKSGRKKAETLSKLEYEATSTEALSNGALFEEEIIDSELKVHPPKKNKAAQDHIQSKSDRKAVDEAKSSSTPSKPARQKTKAGTSRKASAKVFGDSEGPSRRPKKQPKLEAIGDSRSVVADDKVLAGRSGPVQSNKHSSETIEEAAACSKKQTSQQAMQDQAASSKDARRTARKAAKQEASGPESAGLSSADGPVPPATRKPHDSSNSSAKNSAEPQDSKIPQAYGSKGYLLPNEEEQVSWSELGLIDDDVVKYVRQGLRDPNHLKARGEGSKALLDQLIPLAAGEPESRLVYDEKYRIPLLPSFFLGRDFDKHWKDG